MPLSRPRCAACSAPLGDPPYVPLTLRCAACQTETVVTLGADGQPADFDAAFDPGAFLRWLGAARAAMARGTPGIALGACARCRAPLTVSSRQSMRLTCPHCSAAREGAAGALLVDQWPEPWTRIEGGDVSLEYRVAVVDDRTDAAAGCAACTLPTPPADPADRCPRCGATTWVTRHATDGAPMRVQLGVRIDGTRAGRPERRLVPVAAAEAMLRADAARTASAKSGASLLGLTGVGCAIALAFAVLGLFGLTLGIYFATKR
jgi:hypothetical protein